MKLTTMTIALGVVALLGIAAIVSLLRQERIGLRAAAFWIMLWLGLGIFSIFPAALDTFMYAAQMNDRPFFVSLCGILVLLALVFGLTTELEATRRRVAHLVQELALEDLDRERPRALAGASGPEDGEHAQPTDASKGKL